MDSAGHQGNEDSEFNERGPQISSDGRFVAFASLASNLIASDTNGAADIFIRDRLSGTTQLVSANQMGTQGNGARDVPALDSSGALVAFRSGATNLVALDGNSATDVLLRRDCSAPPPAARPPCVSSAVGGSAAVADISGARSESSHLPFYEVVNPVLPLLSAAVCWYLIRRHRMSRP